jgi:hypothetical protein
MNSGLNNLPPGCCMADIGSDDPTCQACDDTVGPKAMDHPDFDDEHPLCIRCLRERETVEEAA